MLESLQDFLKAVADWKTAFTFWGRLIPEETRCFLEGNSKLGALCDSVAKTTRTKSARMSMMASIYPPIQ
jgi:hypothetical protein